MHFPVTHSTTLLSFLKECFPESSTSQIKKWIEQERIACNNNTLISPRALLQEGDTISFLNRTRKETTPFSILFEDTHVIVVDKPAGLLSVDTEAKEEMSLHAHIKKHFPRRKVWVIHRLDRDTSGVILFAFDQESFRSLKDQLKERTMKRRYFALVEGVVEGAGTWDTFLREDSSLVMKVVPATAEGAQRAITHWKALGNDSTSSLLECHLHTGKKNQIRVQAEHCGHPIIGDVKYGSSQKASRIALHAFSLEFSHPITQEKMIFTAQPSASFLALASKKLRYLLEMKTK